MMNGLPEKRGSGILLHVTSLPSPFGIGDLGPGAFRFADFLHETRQSVWQVLPLNPTDPATGNSPYSSSSAFAGNTLLISPEILVDEGFLDRDDVCPLPRLPGDACDYEGARALKAALLEKAWCNFKQGNRDRLPYDRFLEANARWLDEFALFTVLKRRQEFRPWNLWPRELKTREAEAICRARGALADELEKERFFQFLFFKQWAALKGYCGKKGIRIVGDIPIYVSYDSADVWARPELFKLDADRAPLAVAGVPPDYFSRTGQRWGNPVYDWEALKRTDFEWWTDRMAHNLGLFDIVRIDHFRGLVAYWEVPAAEKTAVRGCWIGVPADDLFGAWSRRFAGLPVIAEDLGIITPDVKDVLARYGFPGMKVLLFAFDEDNPDHPYLPHNYERNCVVYTGTHDNNTVRGWFADEASEEARNRLESYIGRKALPAAVHRDFMRLAMMSVAGLAVVPLQDVLGLGREARMNTPSTGCGNWGWRFQESALGPAVRRELREMTETYGRASAGPSAAVS